MFLFTEIQLKNVCVLATAGPLVLLMQTWLSSVFLGSSANMSSRDFCSLSDTFCCGGCLRVLHLCFSCLCLRSACHAGSQRVGGWGVGGWKYQLQVKIHLELNKKRYMVSPSNLYSWTFSVLFSSLSLYGWNVFFHHSKLLDENPHRKQHFLLISKVLLHEDVRM